MTIKYIKKSIIETIRRKKKNKLAFKIYFYFRAFQLSVLSFGVSCQLLPAYLPSFLFLNLF